MVRYPSMSRYRIVLPDSKRRYNVTVSAGLRLARMAAKRGSAPGPAERALHEGNREGVIFGYFCSCFCVRWDRSASSTTSSSSSSSTTSSSPSSSSLPQISTAASIVSRQCSSCCTGLAPRSRKLPCRRPLGVVLLLVLLRKFYGVSFLNKITVPIHFFLRTHQSGTPIPQCFHCVIV